MALINSWKEGKQQRQREIAQRQQSVQQVLAEMSQARQQMAAQLHYHLTGFREGLIQQEQQRRADFAELEAELQQFCQVLREETADFLAMTASDRSLMAQQLSTELQMFHDELQASVQSLRVTMQSNLSTLKVDTQAFLAQCQERRSQIKVETQEDLAAFMEALRDDVQTYLVELESLRQNRAEQLQQDLQRSCTAREADVQALFARFGEFRAELHHFRAALSQIVWGTELAVASAELQPQPTPIAIPKSVPSKPAVKAIAAKPAPKRPISSNKLSTKPPIPASVSKAASKPAAVSKSVPSTKVSVAQSAPTQADSKQNDVAFEKEVYTFLHQQQGARLTHIETALKINRFQAVDALRSLIKKGLITQRDRVYLTQPPLLPSPSSQSPFPNPHSL
ncbi:MAG: gas vesicle protein GvpC [Oscillatoriales cyanobacterium C42_A2020_001]|nr:gas vesicle protein GvpC [Leptolyngbyaceae cyanobacterium C42_A2020_001]